MREAEEVLEQIAAARRGPIVLEVAFDVSPLPLPSRDELLARAMPSSQPLAEAAPAGHMHITRDPGEPAGPVCRSPRGPLPPGAWLSQKSRAALAWSRGAVTRDF